MVFVDTHTHLYDDAFNADRAEAVAEALAAGVETMILPAIDVPSLPALLDLAAKYPANMRVALGLHPTEIRECWRKDLETIFRADCKPVAIGEIGLDLYWDKSKADTQAQVFDIQLGMTKDMNLPVIIHCREALPQVLEVLKGHPGVPAVFHCFSGTKEDVEAIRKVGDYMFGIGGTCTFKNCGVRDTLPEIGLDRILLETDSPYLSPAPFRGRRNSSARIPLIAETVAKSLGVSLEAVADATTSNAENFFTLLRDPR